jgi:cellobiose-specific phosphotransferase system component IIC
VGSFSGICLELGIGIAIGMLAGTTGTHGSARGRMTILAGVIALVIGFLLAGSADVNAPAGAFFSLVGAVFACLVVSDVVSGAGRREGSGAGALGFLVSLAALVVVAIAILISPATLLVLAVLIWLGISRRRRAQRKHAGLRVLR